VFQKTCRFDLQKAWSKVAIAADPTYYKGHSLHCTAIIHVDDDWQLALHVCKKAYELGIENGKSYLELASVKERMSILKSIVEGKKDKKAKIAKRDFFRGNQGAALRLWQDMGIPRPPRTCNLCFMSSSAGCDLSKCAKCQAVYYCSKRCQTLDYKEHKHVCVEPSKENLLDIIKKPNFSEDELVVDENYWQRLTQYSRMQKLPVLVQAANDCHLPAVKRAMMYEGGNVNDKCPRVKEYPIMVAALRNEPDNAVEIVRTLIKHGACPNVVRGDGQHLLAICRGRAKWIDDPEPSHVNRLFQITQNMNMISSSILSAIGDSDDDDDVDGDDDDDLNGCEREERRESGVLVQLVTAAIRQHKLCKLCKARKNRIGYDGHLMVDDNMTDEFLKSFDGHVQMGK